MFVDLGTVQDRRQQTRCQETEIHASDATNSGGLALLQGHQGGTKLHGSRPPENHLPKCSHLLFQCLIGISVVPLALVQQCCQGHSP